MYERVIEAVADRMIAAEEPGIRARDLQVATGILNYIKMLPTPIQKDIYRLIFLFEYLPPLIIFRPTRFSGLDLNAQDRYIEAWGTSRFGLLRSGFRVLKGLCVSTYYQNWPTR
jgi:hypothetical protein